MGSSNNRRNGEGNAFTRRDFMKLGFGSLLALGAAPLLAACDTGGAVATATTAAAGATPAAGGVAGDLTVVWTETTFSGPVWRAMFQQFQRANPNLNLKLLWNGNEEQLIAANTAADLIHTSDARLASLKLGLDLDAMIKGDSTFQLDQFYTQGIDPLRVDGVLRALPESFNISLLYYNKALFDAAGISYPAADWTSEQFLDAARKLTIIEGGKPTQWGVEVEHGWWGTWLTMVRQAGGDFMNAEGIVTLDTPEAIAGMEYFASLVQAGSNKVSWLPKEDNLGGFKSGKVAMSYGSHTGNWGTFRDAGVDYDIQLLPRGLKQQKGGEQAIDALGIYLNSKNPQAAWALLNYVTSTNVQQDYFTQVVGPTGRKDVAQAILKTPKAERKAPQSLEVAYQAFEQGLGMGLPLHEGFIDVAINVVQPTVDLILEGSIPVADGMKKITTDANNHLKQTYGTS